jgi:hypothetical protein
MPCLPTARSAPTSSVPFEHLYVDRRQPSQEFLLDYVLERKSVEDLSASVREARYERQKVGQGSSDRWRVIWLPAAALVGGLEVVADIRGAPGLQPLVGCSTERSSRRRSCLLLPAAGNVPPVSPGVLPQYALKRCGLRHLYYLVEGDPDTLSTGEAALARLVELTRSVCSHIATLAGCCGLSVEGL